MSTPITKQVEVRVKSVDTENFTVDADVSDESVDRHGEIILLSAWPKRLGEYLKNPLLCWQHPVGSWTARQPEDILGKSILTEVTATSLFCRFQYAVRENPKAEMCFNLIAGDYLRSYSIGAIPYAPIYCDAPDIVLNILPEAARAALKSGEVWCVHADMELLEVSNVFVGSNREALARACRDGVITRSVAPELFRSINSATGQQWSVSKQLAQPGLVSVESFAQLSAEVKSLREMVEASVVKPGKGALPPVEAEVDLESEWLDVNPGDGVVKRAPAVDADAADGVSEHSTEQLLAAVLGIL